MGETSAGVETSYDSSPERHQGQPREKLFFSISCDIKLLLNKFDKNTKKKKSKIKQGEQDENEIAQMAASSLLALVNVLDESNKFNRLDEMQNHMSKKITEQRGDLQAANKEESVKINRDKKSSVDLNDTTSFSSSSEDKTMTTPRGLRKQKKYDDSSSNREDDEGQNLSKQKNTMSQAAIATMTKYAKLIQKIAEPLSDGDGNWQNNDKH